MALLREDAWLTALVDEETFGGAGWDALCVRVRGQHYLDADK